MASAAVRLDSQARAQRTGLGLNVMELTRSRRLRDDTGVGGHESAEELT